MKPTLAELMDQLPQTGRVTWIGLRPEKYATMTQVAEAEVSSAGGLHGDRYSKQAGKRQVTLIQAEHIQAMSAMYGSDIEPDQLRRNLVIEGINLLALKGRLFQVGGVLLEWTAPCHPCSRMEEVLGPGGYNLMRGHGGICARVVEGGTLRVGDPLTDAGVIT